MRIMIVEDELLNLESLIYKVSDFSVCETRVFSFDNPKDAAAAADKQIFDLALIDIKMPGMSGIELARILRDKQNELQVAFTTGYNNYATEAYEVGAVDYLLKPVKKDRLHRLLNKVFCELQQKKELRGIESAKNKVKAENQQPVIKLFGGLTVFAGDEVLRWKRSKSAELFAYLLVHMGKPVSKYQICEFLWSELTESKALVNLQTAIYQLRKNISVFGRSHMKIEYADNNYRMITNCCKVDLIEFEAAFVMAKKAMLNSGQYSPEQIEQSFVKAVQLYKEPLLSSEGWSWVHSYQVEQEHKYVEALRYLISAAYIKNDKITMRGYLKKLAAAYGEVDLSFEDFSEFY